MIGIELVKENGTSFAVKEKIGNQVVLEARRRGVIIRPLGDVIVLMPHLSMTSLELGKLLSVTKQSIQKVVGN